MDNQSILDRSSIKQIYKQDLRKTGLEILLYSNNELQNKVNVIQKRLVWDGYKLKDGDSC